jgi:hypothetical protein
MNYFNSPNIFTRYSANISYTFLKHCLEPGADPFLAQYVRALHAAAILYVNESAGMHLPVLVLPG